MLLYEAGADLRIKGVNGTCLDVANSDLAAVIEPLLGEVKETEPALGSPERVHSPALSKVILSSGGSGESPSTATQALQKSGSREDKVVCMDVA
jgi:hypothetical protein